MRKPYVPPTKEWHFRGKCTFGCAPPCFDRKRFALFGKNLFVNALDIRRFVSNIAVDVKRVSLCALLLHAAVRAHFLRMAPQIVAKSKVPAKLRSVLRANIQMMLSKVFFAVVTKDLPSLDFAVAFVHITDGRKRRNYFRKFRPVLDDDVYVYDRLGRKSRDRRAPHMLDADRKLL